MSVFRVCKSCEVSYIVGPHAYHKADSNLCPSCSEEWNALIDREEDEHDREKDGHSASYLANRAARARLRDILIMSESIWTRGYRPIRRGGGPG